MKKVINTIAAWKKQVRALKEQIAESETGIKVRDEILRRLREENSDQCKQKARIAALLIQERRELLARVDKLDILIELSGGVEVGTSPAFTVRR